MSERDRMNAIRPSDLADGFLAAQGFHDHLEFEPWRVPFAGFFGHHQRLLYEGLSPSR